MDVGHCRLWIVGSDLRGVQKISRGNMAIVENHFSKLFKDFGWRDNPAVRTTMRNSFLAQSLSVSSTTKINYKIVCVSIFNRAVPTL
jgi:hypothetical protein